MSSDTNQNISYRVTPFQLLQLEKEAILYTSKGGFSVDNQDMIKKIIPLQKNAGQIYYPGDNLFSTQELEFLCSTTGVLYKQTDLPKTFEQVLILGDNAKLLNLLSEELSVFTNKKIITGENPEKIRINKPTFCVVLLEKYEESFIKKAYQIHADLYLTSYLLDKYFIMDSFYSEKIGSPCHFCNMGQLKNKAAYSLTKNNNSFFFFYNYILKNKLPLSPALPITPLTQNYIYYLLKNKILSVINNEFKLLTPEMLNFMSIYHLNSEHHETDIALHWDYCSCWQEKEHNEAN